MSPAPTDPRTAADRRPRRLHIPAPAGRRLRTSRASQQQQPDPDCSPAWSRRHRRRCTEPAPAAAVPAVHVRPIRDFAQGVASTLFAWDTASGLWPLDYTSAILAVGDPSGDEQAGLASDVAAYLPTRDAWIELRQYATRQHLTIDTTYVPDAWSEAVAQANRQSQQAQRP